MEFGPITVFVLATLAEVGAVVELSAFVNCEKKPPPVAPGMAPPEAPPVPPVPPVL